MASSCAICLHKNRIYGFTEVIKFILYIRKLLCKNCLYRMEGNFGEGKRSRIWRKTINSPKFLPPTFPIASLLIFLSKVYLMIPRPLS